MEEEIRRRIDEMVSRHPRGEQLALLCNLGTSLLGEGLVDGSLVCFDRALRLDPRSTSAWVGRAEALARLNRIGEALGCVERALEQDPKCAPALLLKGDTLGKVGSREEAAACFAAAVEALPEFAPAWVSQGRAFAESGREADAVTSLDRALALDPTPADVWKTHAELLVKLERFSSAAESWARVVALDGSDSDTWLQLGITKSKTTDHGGAKKALKRFVELSPDDRRLSFARSLLAKLDRESVPPPPALPLIELATHDTIEPPPDTVRPILPNEEEELSAALAKLASIVEAHAPLDPEARLALARVSSALQRCLP